MYNAPVPVPVVVKSEDRPNLVPLRQTDVADTCRDVVMIRQHFR
jgi:hypothetical protein